MSLIYTQLAQDTFQRPNENPLNPVNWTAIPATVALQIVSHECEGTDLSNTGAANYTGISWPNDQYIDITVQTVSGGSAAGGLVRSSADQTHGYELVLADIGGGVVTVEVVEISTSTVLFTFDTPFVPGVVFRLSAVGHLISLFQNGVSVGSATDSTNTSGFAGLQESPVTAFSDVQISNFAGGSVTSSGSASIGNSICKPAIIFGRAPNGVLSAVTTDGNGNIDLSGQTPSTVDTIGNSICTPVMIYGLAPNGQFQAVVTDGDGHLNS